MEAEELCEELPKDGDGKWRMGMRWLPFREDLLSSMGGPIAALNTVGPNHTLWSARVSVFLQSTLWYNKSFITPCYIV